MKGLRLKFPEIIKKKSLERMRCDNTSARLWGGEEKGVFSLRLKKGTLVRPLEELAESQEAQVTQ